jgi:hypothetical protein
MALYLLPHLFSPPLIVYATVLYFTHHFVTSGHTGPFFIQLILNRTRCCTPHNLAAPFQLVLCKLRNQNIAIHGDGRKEGRKREREEKERERGFGNTKEW